MRLAITKTYFFHIMYSHLLYKHKKYVCCVCMWELCTGYKLAFSKTRIIQRKNE